MSACLIASLSDDLLSEGCPSSLNKSSFAHSNSTVGTQKGFKAMLTTAEAGTRFSDPGGMRG